MSKKYIAPLLLSIFYLFYSKQVFAHEVYVLSSTDITNDLKVHINVFSILTSSSNLLLFLLFLSGIIVALFASYLICNAAFSKKLGSTIEQFRPYSTLLIRLVLGISLICSAAYKSFFGPELPLTQIGSETVLIFILYTCGIAFLLGLHTRFFAALMIIMYAISALTFHAYMVTYINYFGEFFVLFLLGGETYSVDQMVFKEQHKMAKSLDEFGRKYAFTILRITFGLSLIYTAVYVKFLHPELSLQVISKYHLTSVFPFPPLLTVLCAGIIESLIGLLYVLGLLMRWNTIFFLLFVTASLFYFGEAVWPHFILFGIAIGIFLYGYDSFSLSRWLNK